MIFASKLLGSSAQVPQKESSNTLHDQVNIEPGDIILCMNRYSHFSFKRKLLLKNICSVYFVTKILMNEEHNRVVDVEVMILWERFNSVDRFKRPTHRASFYLPWTIRLYNDKRIFAFNP